jgi:hypothetical protein
LSNGSLAFFKKNKNYMKVDRLSPNSITLSATGYLEVYAAKGVWRKAADFLATLRAEEGLHFVAGVDEQSHPMFGLADPKPLPYQNPRLLLALQRRVGQRDSLTQVVVLRDGRVLGEEGQEFQVFMQHEGPGYTAPVSTGISMFPGPMSGREQVCAARAFTNVSLGPGAALKLVIGGISAGKIILNVTP